MNVETKTGVEKVEKKVNTNNSSSSMFEQETYTYTVKPIVR